MHVDSATVVGGDICPKSVKEDTVTANCIDLDPVPAPTHITRSLEGYTTPTT